MHPKPNRDEAIADAIALCERARSTDYRVVRKKTLRSVVESLRVRHKHVVAKWEDMPDANPKHVRVTIAIAYQEEG